VSSSSTLLINITIAISTSFTYSNNLKTTMTLEVTCPHILLVGFLDCGEFSPPLLLIFIVITRKKFDEQTMMNPTRVQR
jgi:hypothetical protein